MADEKLTNDDELIDGPEAQADEVVDKAEEAFDVAEEAVVEVADVEPVFTEKVEAAVQHVAEEAEMDAKQAEAMEHDSADEKADAPVTEEEPAAKRGRRSKMARAEKEAKADADGSTHAVSKKLSGLATLGVPAWLAISAACLVLGLVLGHFVLSGGGASGALKGKATVTEAELDSTYATYSYNGKKGSISVREILEQNGSPDASKNEDGTYNVPSAELALNVARTAILEGEIESRGIEVTEEDAKAYAEQALGTSDYEAIGATYGMDADSVKELIMENCRVNALREEIIGGSIPTMPDTPAEPEQGKEEEVTKEYAAYIIKLAGDEWDAKKKDWKAADGPFATALADSTTFSADGASYTDAQTAYYVAYQQYSLQQSEMGTSWTEYLNGLMSNASIQIGTLVS